MCYYKRQFKTERLTKSSKNKKNRKDLNKYLKTEYSINKSLMKTSKKNCVVVFC